MTDIAIDQVTCMIDSPVTHPSVHEAPLHDELSLFFVMTIPICIKFILLVSSQNPMIYHINEPYFSQIMFNLFLVILPR